MSGICALYSFAARPVELRAIECMQRALVGWGADTTAPWRDPAGVAALACRFRAVTPEDAFDTQPLVSRDGAHVVVADARIDNRAELAAALGLTAADVACMPDSAFILEAYQAWGDDCVSRLTGDFAFVLWDARRRSLFAARDPIGQRVLYYHRSNDLLYLASGVHALLVLDGVPARLNEQKLAEMLILLEDPATTCYEGIGRLPGGHVLLATAQGVTIRRYWFPERAPSIELTSDDAYVEAFLDLFQRVVRDRMRSTAPVAIMVSAGLDSASIAAVAARAASSNGNRLLGLHAAPRSGFAGSAAPGWVLDESAEVEALAAMHGNIELSIVRGQRGTPLDDLDWLFETVGAPVRNSISLTWIRSLYECAAARGANVMLNGGKGNFTISYTGLRGILDSARSGHIGKAVREARAVAARRDLRPRDVIKDQILRPLLPRPFGSLRRRLRRDNRTPDEAVYAGAIRPGFATAMRLDERVRALHQDEADLDRASMRDHRIRGLMASSEAYDAYHAFRACFAVETREVPTDVRLIEFCLGIPNAQYMRNGCDRQLVRRGMRGLLPESILERTTRGAQAADWPEWFGGMRGEIASELDGLEGNDTARRCLDLPRMRQLVEAWPDAFGPRHTSDYPLLLLRGVVMGRFIRWFEERAR